MSIERELLAENDIVELVGFDCLECGTLRKLSRDGKGNLYFICRDGHHYVPEGARDQDSDMRQLITKVR